MTGAIATRVASIIITIVTLGAFVWWMAAPRTQRGGTIAASDGAAPIKRWTPGTVLVQLGHPRSASTFQFQLLCAIVHLKAMQIGKDATDVRCEFVKRDRWKHLDISDYKQDEYTVLKSHTEPNDAVMASLREGKAMLFYSSFGPKDQGSSAWRSLIALTQQFRAVSTDHPVGQVDLYSDVFDLSPDDVAAIGLYLEDWDKLRLCCGSEQSLWNRLKLHGCHPSKVLDASLHNPHCERHNISALESKMRAPGLPARIGAFPMGKCQEVQERLVSGHDFNDKPFDTQNIKAACKELLKKHVARRRRKWKRSG